MRTGSVVFGPLSLERDLKSASGYSLQNKRIDGNDVQACNCIGPQNGESKCPCALRGEAKLGRKMIDEGVVISGKRYRLVPE